MSLIDCTCTPMNVRLKLCLALSACSLLVDGQAADRSTELLIRALNTTPNAAQGQATYEQQCASCHGPRAWGNADQAIPALAGQRELYLLRQLADFAEQERESDEMHRVPLQLSTDPTPAWRNLAFFLAGQSRNPRPQTGDGRALDLGSGIYRDVCAQCHGDGGEGDDAILSPAIVGQPYSYLLKQLRGITSGHRYANVELELALMLDSMTTDEMAAVADYISRLTGPPGLVMAP